MSDSSSNESAAPSPCFSAFPREGLVRRLYFRALGVVHLVAFLSLWVQIHGLVGEQGILPVASYLELAHEKLGSGAYLRLPTLCWLDASDWTLNVWCAVGTSLSLCLIIGVAPRLMLVSLWVIYLSLSVAGQAFLSFQWDTLLLEATFCSILYAPRGLWPNWRALPPPLPIARWLLWALAFKLMFLSGATKLLSGDPAWLNGTALNYHYFTQPIPNWPSWYVHHWPPAFDRGSLVFLFTVELLLPFLVLGGRWGRAVFALSTMLFMALVEATGNYGFFNLLTAVICLPLLEDDVLHRCCNFCRVGRVRESHQDAGIENGGTRGLVPPYVTAERSKWRTIVGTTAGGLILFVSLLTLIQELVETQGSRKTPILVARSLGLAKQCLLSWGEPWILNHLGPFRTINGYGLFRVMTTQRPEIVIEHSDDGVTWDEYDFPYKPGRIDRAAPIVAPHMPRLDWQMWFAALHPRGHGYWLSALAMRILEGNPATARLMGAPEIAERPPKFVRFAYYEYQFSTPDEKLQTGAWWFRMRRGELTGALSKE